MIYLYDNAICEDLMQSFNPENVENPVVKVIPPEGIVGIAAQIQEDKISFPIIALSRSDTIEIDSERTNFTRMHKGVAEVIDHKTNNVYREKCIPIQLSYKLTAIATCTADMDEILRELMFKYTDMYYLTINLPYESNRKMRFGVRIDDKFGISKSSSSFEYIESGKLYQSILTIECQGCVLLSYTPVHLKRTEYTVQAGTKLQENLK